MIRHRSWIRLVRAMIQISPFTLIFISFGCSNLAEPTIIGNGAIPKKDTMTPTPTPTPPPDSSPFSLLRQHQHIEFRGEKVYETYILQIVYAHQRIVDGSSVIFSPDELSDTSSGWVQRDLANTLKIFSFQDQEIPSTYDFERNVFILPPDGNYEAMQLRLNWLSTTPDINSPICSRHRLAQPLAYSAQITSLLNGKPIGVSYSSSTESITHPRESGNGLVTLTYAFVPSDRRCFGVDYPSIPKSLRVTTGSNMIPVDPSAIEQDLRQICIKTPTDFDTVDIGYDYVLSLETFEAD